MALVSTSPEMVRALGMPAIVHSCLQCGQWIQHVLPPNNERRVHKLTAGKRAWEGQEKNIYV